MYQSSQATVLSDFCSGECPVLLLSSDLLCNRPDRSSTLWNCKHNYIYYVTPPVINTVLLNSVCKYKQAYSYLNPFGLSILYCVLSIFISTQPNNVCDYMSRRVNAVHMLPGQFSYCDQIRRINIEQIINLYNTYKTIIELEKHKHKYEKVCSLT